jgi:putative transposase
MARPRKPVSSFRYFNSSPEMIRPVVMTYVKFALSSRNVEDLVAERGIDICHETVRFWWNRFGGCCQTKVTRSGSATLRPWFWAAASVLPRKHEGEKPPPSRPDMIVIA